MPRHLYRIIIGIIAFIAFVYTMPPARNDAPKHDRAELEQIVRLSFPSKSIRWEIFETPEFKGGGAPSPTEFNTLVVELEPLDKSWATHLGAISPKAWIAPEGAREWLSPYFRALLDKARMDRSVLNNCRDFSATLTETGKHVSGFACEYRNTVLLHLILHGPTLPGPEADGPPIFE